MVDFCLFVRYRHLITLGWSKSLICFKNISIKFDFSWINAPFDAPELEKPNTITIDDLFESTQMDSWKSLELARLAREECENYECQLKTMHNDLERIKNAVVDYLNMNELEAEQEQFPIQFFNLNATEADIQSGALKEQIEFERVSLEKSFCGEKLRIENIKQIMWNCFETKPQKLQGIFTDIFIQNFPLTDMDEKLSDDMLLQKLLSDKELFNQISELKPWIHPSTTIKEEINWPTIDSQTNKLSERFSTFASKIIDQHLTANVNLDYNFFGTLPMEPETVDIHNETLVNIHNVKVYVRIFPTKMNL